MDFKKAFMYFIFAHILFVNYKPNKAKGSDCEGKRQEFPLDR